MVHWQTFLIMLVVALLSFVSPAGSAPRGERASEAAQSGARPGGPTAAAKAGPVNINTAGVSELMTLSGVGRTVAERIVQYRETHGLFKKPEEVQQVQGIGAGLWERNRNRIVVK